MQQKNLLLLRLIVVGSFGMPVATPEVEAKVKYGLFYSAPCFSLCHIDAFSKATTFSITKSKYYGY